MIQSRLIDDKHFLLAAKGVNINHRVVESAFRNDAYVGIATLNTVRNPYGILFIFIKSGYGHSRVADSRDVVHILGNKPIRLSLPERKTKAD